MNPKQANAQYGDKVRFNEACRAICGSVPSRNGIGVLSEKTLHSVIKRFIEPNEVLQEVKVGDYYADIKNDDGIFEVQTRSFNRLRAKLTSYLEPEEVSIALVDFTSLSALRFTSNLSIMDIIMDILFCVWRVTWPNKTPPTSGLKSKFGMPRAYCAEISTHRNINRSFSA